jgi:hypothetical protein
VPTHETTVAVHDWSPSRVAIDCVSKGTAISNGQAVIAACQVHVASITVLAPFGVANKSFPLWVHDGTRGRHEGDRDSGWQPLLTVALAAASVVNTT